MQSSAFTARTHQTSRPPVPSTSYTPSPLFLSSRKQPALSSRMLQNPSSSSLHTSASNASVNTTASEGNGAPQPTRTATKQIYLIRHGQTEMNVWLSKYYQGIVSIEDPLLYDTRLTHEGEQQALKLSAKVQRGNLFTPAPELLVVSPLTRALQTTQLAFDSVEGFNVPRVILDLASERVWHSSDVGRSPAELSEEFPDYEFAHLNQIWWFNGKSKDTKRVVVEPDELFFARMERLREWLLARPESVIAIVCHWGVINALTGKDPSNCEVVKVAEKDLWLPFL